MLNKSLPHPNDLPACTGSTDEVKIVSQYHIDKAMYGDSWPSWDQQCEDIQRWCADHSASYYAAPKEDFFLFIAIDAAKAEGNKIVVVENLS
jgi:hypothetical protein